MDAVNNSRSQLEHQEIRIINLELLRDYGCNSWTLYLQQLQQISEQQQGKLHGLRQKIQVSTVHITAVKLSFTI